MKPGTKPNQQKPSDIEGRLKPAARAPRPPAFLTAAAKAHFRKVAKWLHEAEIIRESDTDALAIYCQAYATWAQAIKDFDTDLQKQLQGQLRQMQNEFGMTPASRSRVRIPEKGKAADDWSDL